MGKVHFLPSSMFRIQHKRKLAYLDEHFVSAMCGESAHLYRLVSDIYNRRESGVKERKRRREGYQYENMLIVVNRFLRRVLGTAISLHLLLWALGALKLLSHSMSKLAQYIIDAYERF